MNRKQRNELRQIIKDSPEARGRLLEAMSETALEVLGRVLADYNNSLPDDEPRFSITLQVNDLLECKGCDKTHWLYGGISEHPMSRELLFTLMIENGKVAAKELARDLSIQAKH